MGNVSWTEKQNAISDPRPVSVIYKVTFTEPTPVLLQRQTMAG